MNRLFTFIGGNQGVYQVTRIETVRGESLQTVERLAVVSGELAESMPGVSWSLHGITSYERYTNRSEKEQLLLINQRWGVLKQPAPPSFPYVRMQSGGHCLKMSAAKFLQRVHATLR